MSKSSSSSNINSCVIVALFIYSSWECVVPVSCQETRLNVVFPQLELLGAASGPTNPQPTSSSSQDTGPVAQKLQQAQADLIRLKGLLKNLLDEEGSAKNEKLETQRTTAATTLKTTPRTTAVTPSTPIAPKPKEIAPNIDSNGIAPFFANLAGVNTAPIEDFDVDALHNEIEALQKQLNNRDDNNSRNTFVNQPVKEAPTAFHFHSEQTPPRQSYFDHTRQDTSYQNYLQDAPKYRSAASDLVREMEYDYFIHPLMPRPSDIKTHQENTAAGSTYVPNAADQKRLVHRHQRPPPNYEGYNNYASAYGYMPQHYANQYSYADDSKSQPSEYYKEEVKPEYKAPNNEKYEELYYANQPGYGPSKQEYGSPYQGYETSKQGYGLPKQEYGTPTQGYGSPNQGYGSSNQGHGRPKQAYGSPNQGYVQNPQGNKHSVAGRQGFHGVILQFILEVVRMIAGGNGSGLIAMILRLPGMIIRGILQTAGNSLARDGLRGVIARGIIPTIVLIGSNLLMIFLTWFMWDDGTRSVTTGTTADTTTQGFLAPLLQNLIGNVGT